eukprot:356032-Chlamydomonas_euryale.AAC.1
MKWGNALELKLMTLHEQRPGRSVRRPFIRPGRSVRRPFIRLPAPMRPAGNECHPLRKAVLHGRLHAVRALLACAG